MPPTPSKIWEDSKFGSKPKGVFCKNRTTTYLTTTPSKSFCYFLYIFLRPLTHEKINRIHDVTIIDVKGVQ